MAKQKTFCYQAIGETAWGFYEANPDRLPNFYLITRKSLDNGTQSTSLKTSYDIFKMLDMWDCIGDTEEILSVYHIRPDGKAPERCELLGTWHDPSDPLLMRIITAKSHRILDEDYGTDH